MFKRKEKKMQGFKIINISFPVLHEAYKKPVGFDDKWRKALQTIKRWGE